MIKLLGSRQPVLFSRKQREVTVDWSSRGAIALVCAVKSEAEGQNSTQVVQRLRLCAPNAEGSSSILGTESASEWLRRTPVPVWPRPLLSDGLSHGLGSSLGLTQGPGGSHPLGRGRELLGSSTAPSTGGLLPFLDADLQGVTPRNFKPGIWTGSQTYRLYLNVNTHNPSS